MTRCQKSGLAQRKPARPGDRFGSLTVLSCEYRPHTSPSHLGKSLAWAICRCDCGKNREAPVNDLRTGKTTSCGCKSGRPKGGKITHGGCSTRLHGREWEPLYLIWAGMKLRCSGAVKRAVKYYSAKGIKVCANWMDYAVFREWALSHGYKPGLTIHRKESGGNYEPGNCEWLTRGENARLANEKRIQNEKLLRDRVKTLEAQVEILRREIAQLKLERGVLV